MRRLLSKATLGLFALYVLFSCSLNAQPALDDQLRQQYWDLRNDFQKYFVKVKSGGNHDINIGGSLPIASRDMLTYTNYGITNCGQDNVEGVMRFGDEPQLLGFYIATLATEYKLKKDAGEDTRSTLHELYYAIEAVSRLDYSAEKYLSNNTQPGNINGFLCRDDVDQNFAQDFYFGQFPITGDPLDWMYHCTKSDAYVAELSNTFNENNEMSQDHVFNLLFGFAFVKEVEDGLLVNSAEFTHGR